MAAYLILKTLVCQVTEDDTGSDEIYIKVNGDKVWGNNSMNDGDTLHILSDHSNQYLKIPVTLGRKVDIEIYDQDGIFDPDDKLGIWSRNIAEGDYGATFRGNWSFYTLFFSVEDDNRAAELEIVKPSLGQPKICSPRELLSISATVATRSVVKNISKAIQQIGSSIFLQDAESKRKYPCQLKINNNHQIEDRRRYFQKIRKGLNDKKSKFPRTNNSFRAGCGLVTDFEVTINVDVDSHTQLKGDKDWPRMFNLIIGEHVSYNCLYASESLSESSELTFLHVTDTHVAHIFDIIGQQLEGYPRFNKREKKKILNTYQNPNDHLRAIIDYANENAVDFVVITGDLVNYASDGWFKIKPRKRTNYHRFVEIITGKSKNGRRLQCPLFVVPGNHEFYPFGLPLQFRIEGGTGAHISLGERKDEIKSINLDGFNDSLELIDNYYGTKLYKNNFIRHSVAYVLITNTYPQFYPYLMEISYDVSYKVKIGNHCLVFLNTSNDKGRPSIKELSFEGVCRKIAEILTFGEEKELGTDRDYMQGGSQCQGFSNEDVRIFKKVMNMQNNASGLILLFSHAPLVNLEGNPDYRDGIENIFEYQHKITSPPPPANSITKFFSKMNDSTNNYILLSIAGYPQGGTRYFYKFPNQWDQYNRNELIDYGCAFGGGFKEIVQLINGTHPDVTHYYNNTIVFSGHTHHINEYRFISPQDMGKEGPYIGTENYSGSNMPSVPKGHTQDQLPSNQGDPAAWRRKNFPLMLISGSLKGKRQPMFREIHVHGSGLNAAIKSMQVKKISRFNKDGVTYLHSYNYDCLYIRHKHFLGELTEITTDLDRNDAEFKFVSGLASDKCISIESVNYPGYYLRHENFRIKLIKYSPESLNNDSAKLFREDASFRIVPGLMGDGISFESYNYPNYYIRHKNYHLYVQSGEDNLFKSDSTFITEAESKTIIDMISPPKGIRGTYLEYTIKGRGVKCANSIVFSGNGVSGTILSSTNTKLKVRIRINGSAKKGARSFTISTPLFSVISSEYGVKFKITGQAHLP